MARPKAVKPQYQFNVRYFCTFTRREYTHTILATDAQEAANECRRIQEVNGVLIRVIEVAEVRNDWQ